jgi:hypothetical protein
MKFSLKNFTSPSTLILFALLATFLFYLYFKQSSHDMDLDFYDYDSDDLEDDDMEGFKEGAKFVKKRWDPVRANKQAAKRRRRRRRRR